MKVFLSWSSNKSKETAKVLGDYFGQMIQAIEPWISSEISKGANWAKEIGCNLEEINFGIICLTRENIDENWILFEAGALSKNKGARVCIFLLDLTYTDIKPPLALFQHTEFKEDDVRKLVHTVNKALKDVDERSLPEESLNKIFDRFWPDIEKALKLITDKPTKASQPIRSEREILEEILETVRAKPIDSLAHSYPSRDVNDAFQQRIMDTIINELPNGIILKSIEQIAENIYDITFTGSPNSKMMINFNEDREKRFGIHIRWNLKN